MKKELDKVYNTYIKKYQSEFNKGVDVFAIQENAKKFDGIYESFGKAVIKKANVLLENDNSLKKEEIEEYTKELVLNFGRSIINPF